ncbi:MobF family relaxase [Ruania zhangjianzhongii]|uniref:MobF family relaxase n=1 Tax=Ruania zhangjianzhongii TaxID=2603206 RepID=UPI0031450C1B
MFASFKAENDRDPLPGPERDELRWAAARQVSGRLHEGPVSDAQVAQLLASVGREQRHPVAGYDLVFTPAKSVSTLWALADEPVQAQVADAHRAAWREALAWVEKEAGLTRLGAGGVKQVDTHGLIAAAFDHLDSRAGDPNLHTHVAVSNRVQARSADPDVDGRWLSLDGRVLHALGVAASERYNGNVERELKARLGVEFAPEARADGGCRCARSSASTRVCGRSSPPAAPTSNVPTRPW